MNDFAIAMTHEAHERICILASLSLYIFKLESSASYLILLDDFSLSILKPNKSSSLFAC